MIRDYGGAEPTACLYVDPLLPRIDAPRTTASRCWTTTRTELFADALNECIRRPERLRLAAYAELFDGWHRMDLTAPTTLSGDTDRTEVLWSNRPIGEPDLFTEFGEPRHEYHMSRSPRPNHPRARRRPTPHRTDRRLKMIATDPVNSHTYINEDPHHLTK